MAYAELCLDMRIGLIDGNWNNGTVLCIDNELLQDPTALGHYSDMVDEAKNTQITFIEARLIRTLFTVINLCR